ncbi:hypothetical protein CIW48_26915 [Methylobacterium sp. P1-11]|uniref:hypothetical protein n=1 Tax=Methylobacterium sp. P1-11 TaxID=2024616 RepID=UPI0011EE8733|nr:hypothetical protein [Methylobacterium sp. P1-11]KAA0117840.1 hypothetical protein CIW48_26915 [Methylobacterium sp. P1-11]
MSALLLIALGAGIVLLPSLLVIALITIATLRRDLNAGNSQPAADEVAPVVVGRAEIGCLVAANDREAA